MALETTHFLYRCGPTAIRLSGDIPQAVAKIDSLLSLFDVQWPELSCTLDVQIMRAPAPDIRGKGTYLTTRKMWVDPAPDGLQATCEVGTYASYSAAEKRWTIYIVAGKFNGRVSASLEDIISLIVTTAWREAGWVPLHAGAVLRDGVCALLCAPSGGGKTTLTTALINHGWQTLGDDKLLLRANNGQIELRALLHIFNIHPEAERWFRQLAGLRTYPEYSIWTPKRRLPIETFWLNSRAYCARPSHMVQIRPVQEKGVVRLHPLGQTQILETLLCQTVIPNEPTIARRILQTVTQTAERLIGFEMHLGREIYSTPAILEEFEEMLLASRPSWAH